MKLLPRREHLGPLFRSSENDPAASRTLADVFSGNAPAYALLKHPRTLARAVRESVGGA